MVEIIQTPNIVIFFFLTYYIRMQQKCSLMRRISRNKREKMKTKMRKKKTMKKKTAILIESPLIKIYFT
jgi:hypothetical protein